MFTSDYDRKRNGWCIFKQDETNPSWQFWSGPFKNKEQALSATKKLNTPQIST